MLSWQERKRLFLSDYFLKNKINSELLNPNNSQDFEVPNKYNIYCSTTPWATLLEDSKKYEKAIIPGPLETNSSGFMLEDPVYQNLFESAFIKCMVNLSTYVDYDDETLLFNMIEYILVNGLHKKGLHYLIKKLKNLDADMLPYEF